MGISKVLSPAAITNSGFSFSLSRSTAVPLFRVCGTTYTFSPLEKTSTYFVSRDVFKSFTTVSGSLHFVKINSFSMYRSSNFLRGSRSTVPWQGSFLPCYPTPDAGSPDTMLHPAHHLPEGHHRCRPMHMEMVRFPDQCADIVPTS